MRRALLVAGTDLGDRMRIEPVEGTARRMMRAAFHYMYLLRIKAPGLREPLAYPDPNGEFYGYERWGQLEPDRSWSPGLRQLVATVAAMSATRLAVEAGLQAESKAHSVRLSRAHLDSEFADYLGQLYSAAGVRWAYRIPAGSSDRAELRRCCEAMLGTETDFIARCRPYLLGALAGSDQRLRAHAGACLDRVRLRGVSQR